MRGLNKQAQTVFQTLTRGLEVGQSRKLDRAPGAFMAVHIEHLEGALYSVAHYYEQNGDLMADPDVEFWVAADGRVLPASITQAALGRFEQALVFDAQGQVDRYRPRTLRDLVAFTNLWMGNIRQQQLGR